MKLPPHDSVKDKILLELLQRERLADVKKWEISLQAIGAFLGIKGDDVLNVVTPLRNKLIEELFHLGYDMRRLQAKVAQRAEGMREQREQMEKLNRMG